MRSNGALSGRQQKWAGLIRQQEESGVSVSAFCRDHDISDASFYTWRKRLETHQPVRFALVDTGASAAIQEGPLELILPSGDRLRIAPGTDAGTLRIVLSVLRERA